MSDALKSLDRFSDKEAVLQVAERLRATAKGHGPWQFMEFCGGHTHVLFRFGLRELLPPELSLVHGPGCPVCVLPRGKIDAVLDLLVRNPDVILCTYADLLRVPGTAGRSLLRCRADGATVRAVYSPHHALDLAQQNPHRKVVFLAIGFETTTPATAITILEAQRAGLTNFFVYSLHLLTPPAVAHVLESPEIREHGTVQLDGFIGPGHVCAVIGTEPFEYFATEFQKPVVITGFAPVDMMLGLLALTQLAREGASGCRVENLYPRVVTRQGNTKAKAIVADVFELRRLSAWRGLGMVPYSAFRLRPAYQSFDAEHHFDIREFDTRDHPACLCSAIVRGVKKPTDCKLYGTGCTPDTPIGSCMVSGEGTCAAYFASGIGLPRRKQNVTPMSTAKT